jgi:hypothetical protein
MDKITEYEVIRLGGEIVPHIHIERPDGSFVTMTKEYWEAQQAAQAAAETNYLTLPAIMESTQPDEADLTEGTN